MASRTYTPEERLAIVRAMGFDDSRASALTDDDFDDLLFNNLGGNMPDISGASTSNAMPLPPQFFQRTEEGGGMPGAMDTPTAQHVPPTATPSPTPTIQQPPPPAPAQTGLPEQFQRQFLSGLQAGGIDPQTSAQAVMDLDKLMQGGMSFADASAQVNKQYAPPPPPKQTNNFGNAMGSTLSHIGQLKEWENDPTLQRVIPGLGDAEKDALGQWLGGGGMWNTDLVNEFASSPGMFLNKYAGFNWTPDAPPPPGGNAPPPPDDGRNWTGGGANVGPPVVPIPAGTVSEPIANNTPHPNAFQPVAPTIPAPTEADGTTPRLIGGNAATVQTKDNGIAPSTVTPFGAPPAPVPKTSMGDTEPVGTNTIPMPFPEGTRGGDLHKNPNGGPPVARKPADGVTGPNYGDATGKASFSPTNTQYSDIADYQNLGPEGKAWVDQQMSNFDFLFDRGYVQGTTPEELRNHYARLYAQSSDQTNQSGQAGQAGQGDGLPTDLRTNLARNNLFSRISDTQNSPEETNELVQSLLGLSNLDLQNYFNDQFPPSIEALKNFANMYADNRLNADIDVPGAERYEMGADQVYTDGKDAADWMQYVLDNIDKTQIPIENLRDVATVAAQNLEGRGDGLQNSYRADVEEDFAEHDRQLRERLAARNISNSTIADEQINRLADAKNRALSDADLRFFTTMGGERRADTAQVGQLLSQLFNQQMDGSRFAIDKAGALSGAVGQAEDQDLARRLAEYQRIMGDVGEDQRMFDNTWMNNLNLENIINQRFGVAQNPIAMLLSALSGTNVAPGTVGPLQMPRQGMGTGEAFGNMLGGLVSNLPFAFK